MKVIKVVCVSPNLAILVLVLMSSRAEGNSNATLQINSSNVTHKTTSSVMEQTSTVTPTTSVQLGYSTATPTTTTSVHSGSSTATPTTTSVQLGSSTATPTITSVQLGSSTVTPTTTSVQLGSSTPTPSTTSVQPGSSTPTPTTISEKPGSSTGTPTTTSVQPGSSTATPTTTTQPLDPVMYPYGHYASPDYPDAKYIRNSNWFWWWTPRCPLLELDYNGFPFFGRRHYQLYICPNGLMSFDEPWYRWWPYNFGQYFWFDQHAMLAPYWSLIDLYDSFNNDISQMYYHVYKEHDENPSTPGILQRAVDDVNKHTKYNPLPTEFRKATFVLVVTWVKLRHRYSRWRQVMFNKFNTFQAVLITDGVYSFVLYNYPENGIQWSAPDERKYYYRYWYDRALPVVGINAGDTNRNYFNHPRSGRVTIADINQIEGMNIIKSFGDSTFQQTFSGVRGRLFIRLEDSPGLRNSMIECSKWYNTDIWELRNLGLPSYLSALEPCPCTYWQAWRDRRFRFYSGRWPVYCFLSRFRSLYGWGQECCYEFVRTRGFWRGWWWWFPLLTSGYPNGGNAQRYHRRLNPQQWQQNDYKAYRDCCINSNLCWMFQERRPSDTCRGYIPPSLTWVRGDPHFVTLDGKNYTFNGLGEYVMMDAKDGYFQLQARTKLAKGNGTATVFSGAVAKENNTSTVQVTLADDNGTLEVLVDGKLFDYAGLTNESKALDGSVSVSKPEHQCFEMSFPSGMSVKTCEKHQQFSIITAAPNSFKTKTKGLLGTWNDDNTDDFTLPNGTVLSDDISSRDIHFKFGLLWQVNSSTSLFTYKPGENVSTFINSSFVPMFVDNITWPNEELRKAAKRCQGDVACLFDVASTGDVSVGVSTKQIGSQLVNDSSKMNNGPPKFSNSSSEIYLKINSTVTVIINATDPEGDDITFNISGLPDDIYRTSTSTSVVLNWKVTSQKFELVVVATDSKGASSVFEPAVYLCSCHNNGTCEKASKFSDMTASDPGKSRFFIMTCNCGDGYTGQYCETDVDACEANLNPCYPGVTCTDLPPPANMTDGYKCGPCPSGYTGSGANCTDVNECDGNNDCAHVCGNTPGSYECSCNKGYELNVDKKSCNDVNECLPASDCMHNCTNSPGSYNCSCYQYFKIDPSNAKKCIPENPCTSDSELRCEQVCYVAGGKETCACYQGYELANDQKACKDIDECSKNLYRCQQQCHNTIGGYTCSCIKGFELASDNVTCNDINECMRWTFNCTDVTQNCVNTVGSYKCECDEGLYWIDNKCRALKKGEARPPPPPASTPKSPTTEEQKNAVIIELDKLNVSQWNSESETKFKEAVAKAVTAYCANHSCGVRDSNRVIRYTADQVHLVPGYPSRSRIAFYVNHPPGVALQSDKTIKVETLIKIVEEHEEDIGKSLNAKITNISPYTNELQKESDYKLIIIGLAVGGVVVLLLLLIAVKLCLKLRQLKVGKENPDEHLTEKELEMVQNFPLDELEMQTEVPRANNNLSFQ